MNKPMADASISLKTADPHLGGYCEFDVVYPHNLKNPYVMLVAYQDEVPVYIEGEPPGGVFTLGGGEQGSSQWKTNGGPATCVAYIQSATWKAGVESIDILATVTFQAMG